MNNVNLVGRVTKDIELKVSRCGSKVYTYFTLAVNRYAGREKGQVTDFIDIVAFDKQAETLSKYVFKGDKIAINGRLDTGSYEGADGAKKYFSKVILDDFSFMGNKSDKKAEIMSIDSAEVPF